MNPQLSLLKEYVSRQPDKKSFAAPKGKNVKNIWTNYFIFLNAVVKNAAETERLDRQSERQQYSHILPLYPIFIHRRLPVKKQLMTVFSKVE